MISQISLAAIPSPQNKMWINSACPAPGSDRELIAQNAAGRRRSILCRAESAATGTFLMRSLQFRHAPPMLCDLMVAMARPAARIAAVTPISLL